MSKKRLSVLSGAGVSAESGLATFRDSGGQWGKYDPMVVASHSGWNRDKGRVLEFYNLRRRELATVKPNSAHFAIAELEQDYDVTVITQNVDNLHERAGSTKIIHLHGELTKVRPEHGVYDENGSEAEVFDVGYSDVNLGDLAPNGEQLRPHIVFFEEAVPKIEDAIEVMYKTDILLIIGTSLNVYPAAGLYRYTDPSIPIYLIDPKDVQVFDKRIQHIKEPATVGMERFKEILRTL